MIGHANPRRRRCCGCASAGKPTSAPSAPDPVLELVEKWHREFAELGVAMDRVNAAAAGPEEKAVEAAQAEASDRLALTAHALARTTPTTLAGLAAKARVAAWYFGLEFPGPGIKAPEPECIDVAFALVIVADARLAAGMK